MTTKLSYLERISLEIKKSRKENNDEKIRYYTECLKLSACQSYELFKTLYHYTQWKTGQITLQQAFR